MTRRTERVGNLLRNTIGEILHQRLADPRIDAVKTSVTRVEIPADLLTAKVFISVMDDEAAQRRTLEALNNASGRIQGLMMREVELRHCPRLTFVMDVQFRRTMETLAIIQQTSEELRVKDAERAEREALESDDVETQESQDDET
jgi:ribosome-binding factor A